MSEHTPQTTRTWSGVLFDLDGTLTDSAPGITQSLAGALEEIGHPVADPDSLTVHVGPPLHETLRVQIPNSSLVIIPRAYHAFTLEKPALTADLLARFADDVLAGRWKGNKTVWIAPEEVGGDLMPFPAGYDHLRAIPVKGGAV